MNTRLLLRAAALATLLTTIGHLTGSPHLLGSLWVPTNAQQGSDVVRAMQAYRFEAMGFETSVFDFYSGFGWQLGAYLLGHAIFIWLLADISSALSAVKLRVIVGVFFLEFLAASLLALLTWKSFWIPAAANGLPAAFLAAAWIAGRPHTAESGSGLLRLHARIGPEESQMEESVTSDHKSTSRWWRSPVVLMRVSSILFFLTMFGHAAAYPWTSTTRDLRETMLVESMKDTPYVFFSHTPYRFFGEHTTYWGLYFGWGLLVPILLLTLAVVVWILSDLAHLDSWNVGAISGVLSAESLAGAYISFRFFFTPPVLTYSAICILLMTAAVQLLRRRDHQ